MFSKVKKLFSILAIAMMVTSVLPLNVLADETTTANTENVASSSAEVQESTSSSVATTTNNTEVTTPSTETPVVSDNGGTPSQPNAPNTVEQPTTSAEQPAETTEKTVVSSKDDGSSEQPVDMDKIAQLASRPFPEVYSTKGLTNAEIEQLGLAIWGTYFDGETYMTNDKGEQVKIPYKKQTRHVRAVTSSKRIYVSYIMSGFGTTTSYTHMAHHYVDGKYAFCIEPNNLFYSGMNYSSTNMDLSNPTYKRINDVLNFGAQDDSNDVNSAYTQLMVWEALGWSTTSVGGEGSLAGFQAYKASVNDKINKFYSKASFNGQTLTVKLGESVSVTDTNGVVQDMGLIANSANVGVAKNGNTVTITPNANSSERGSIVFGRNLARTGTALIWGDGSERQKVATPGALDPSGNRSSLNINVLKNGEGKLGKVDENGNPVPNAEFEVKNVTTGEKRTLTTNENGEFNVEYPDGTVLEIRETKAPYGFYRDQQVKTVTIQANQTVNVSFTNIHQKGKLILTKEDVETGGTPQADAVLDNAVYALYKADGTFVQNITFSGRTGVATDLDLGAYYLQEVKAPTGYVLDKRRIDVNIPYAGQDVKISVTDKTVTDKVIKGSIKGWKFGNKNLIDKDVDVFNSSRNVKNPLQGVEITARSYTTGIEYKAVTDNNGYFEINNLPYDKYQLLESKGKEGYRLFMPFDFEIRTDGVVHHYLLEDKVIENKIKIVKIDADTGRTIPIAGVQFKIYDKVKGAYISMLKPNSDQKSEIFETNAEGYLLTSDTLLYGKDRYRLEEVQAPYRYTKGEPITFSVDSKGNAEILVVDYANEEQMGKVILNKTVEKPVGLVDKSSSLGDYKQITFEQQSGQGFEFKIRATEDIVKPEGTLVYHKGDFIKQTTEDKGFIPDGSEQDEVITTDVNGRAVSYPKVHKIK